MPLEHRAITAFSSQIGTGLAFGQVWIQPQKRGYELRHVGDQQSEASSLRKVTAVEVRHLSQFTKTGVFRPLKGSPDLPSGWRLEAETLADLDFALGQLYPGSVADWYTTQERPDAATHYRDYTNRQTGMYRVTALVSDKQARNIAQACCDAHFCLKRRLWTVPELPVDAIAEKSVIPCLEPCPVLMEFARKAARIEQEEPVPPTLYPEELRSLKALIQQTMSLTSTSRQADFADPLNPRRLQLLLNKFSSPADEPAKAAE